MTHRGRTSVARGHLRIAAPAAPHRRIHRSRALLLLRALAVALWIVVLNVAALVWAAVALVPLLWQRRPAGRRSRPLRREARVIPMPVQRQRASPR